MPHRHRLCHASSTIVLSHSALVNIPPVKIPLPPSPKRSNVSLVSFPLRAFAFAHARCFRSSIVLCLWPLTILLPVLFPPRLPAVVVSHFPFVASHFPFVSRRLVLCSVLCVFTIAFVPLSPLFLEAGPRLSSPLLISLSCAPHYS